MARDWGYESDCKGEYIERTKISSISGYSFEDLYNQDKDKWSTDGKN